MNDANIAFHCAKCDRALPRTDFVPSYADPFGQICKDCKFIGGVAMHGEYLILTADSPLRLAEKVQELMHERWTVQGSISLAVYVTDGHRVHREYAQAMVRGS